MTTAGEPAVEEAGERLSAWKAQGACDPPESGDSQEYFRGGLLPREDGPVREDEVRRLEARVPVEKREPGRERFVVAGEEFERPR